MTSTAQRDSTDKRILRAMQSGSGHSFWCPFCDALTESVAIDGRHSGTSYRRRRVCLACQHRYTTYEQATSILPEVVKRGGHREPFDREKLRRSIAAASPWRRRVAAVETIADDVEAAVVDRGVPVSAADLGDLVASRLRAADPLAYLRYISAQRHFTDVRQFLEEAKTFVRSTETAAKSRRSGAVA